MSKQNKIVAVPMGAVEFFGKTRPTYLVHAVELDSEGNELRVLCSRVKLHHLCLDSTMYDRDPVTCPTCANKKKKAEKV